ncbi:MAG TPA: DUF2505 domain-containing protein, partial [Pseudomonadales bacterium]|nr:DUF2505 domain-containing protein [Pseudomonadales bacterium]
VMTIHAQYLYTMPVNALFGLLTDPNFMENKYLAAGSRKLHFSQFEQREGKHLLRWSRELEADVPMMVRSLFDIWNRFDESMDWRLDGDTGEGIYSAKIKGGLVELKGLFYIRPHPQGCVESVEMQVKVNVPLMRDKIASLAEKGIQTHLDEEYTFTQNWVRQHATV